MTVKPTVITVCRRCDAPLSGTGPLCSTCEQFPDDEYPPGNCIQCGCDLVDGEAVLCVECEKGMKW